MIDVHIMVTQRDIPYLPVMLESLKDEPILLHVIDGVVDHIGKGRIKGFSLGQAPYVGWVDPDDTIVPGAYRKCFEYLQNNPTCDGVYMYENQYYGENIRLYKAPHHMTVIKRELLESLYPLMEKNWLNPERYINEIKTLKCIPEVGYNHNILKDSFVRLRANDLLQKYGPPK